MPTRVSAEGLTGIDNKYEPQRKNNFTLEIPDIPGGGAMDSLRFALSKIPFPTETTKEEVIEFGNERRYFAGKTEYSTEELTVIDYVTAATALTISEWRKKVYDPENGEIGYAGDYKRDGSLIMFGPKGNKDRTWVLKGLWPSKVNYGEGDMASSESNKIVITFRVDRIIPESLVAG